jgi:glycosyl transferase, family 25
MKLYFINLSRRRDRREAMESQAGRLGLSLTRIEALDAKEAKAKELARWFRSDGPLGEIPKGDQCCSLSHRRVWNQFHASGAPYAAVLEDDVRLRQGAHLLLGKSDWIPQTVDLIKLEHYGPQSQSVLLSDFVALRDGFRLGRMRSRHTGAAAYIISRRAAEILLEIPQFGLPVDHLLFNPNNSRWFKNLKPWQLLPVIARQRDSDGSDIEGWRVGLRKFDLTYARRELVRFGYDLRLLPGQLALLATGKAKFVRVGNAV